MSLALVGVLVAVISGLGFVVWGNSIGARHPVLVFTRDVEAGHRIDDGDVREARIAAPDTVSIVPGADRVRVVGKVVLTKAYAGALVQRAQLARRARLPAGLALVGVTVGAGESPVAELHAGQVVQVVRTGGSTGDRSADAADVLVESAVVHAVTAAPDDSASATQQGARFVSLRVPEPAAADVAAAAASGGLRLVLTGP